MYVIYTSQFSKWTYFVPFLSTSSFKYSIYWRTQTVQFVLVNRINYQKKELTCFNKFNRLSLDSWNHLSKGNTLCFRLHSTTYNF